MPESTIIHGSTTFTTKNPGKSTSNQSTVSMKSKRNPKQKSKTANSDTLLEIITSENKSKRQPKTKVKILSTKNPTENQKESSMRKTRRKVMNLSNQMS
ncbi:hypothetical protein Indivirus_1_198 [Indivirus ILV1]|uniref:Uncharacterized protein n=1 Tax=Indivirus ILV1 TaxID=1977633 RepID=A0A1V0SCY7_9VIRU|nr:hypothetical protein Indivirus_1_198 [Indivirus ILV1]